MVQNFRVCLSEVDEDEEWAKEDIEWAADGVMSAQVCGVGGGGGRMREPRMSLVTHCQVRELAHMTSARFSALGQ